METMEEEDEVLDITPKTLNSNSKIKSGQGSKSSTNQYQRYYKQAYRSSWESQPDFKGWLRGVEGQPSRAYCSYCQVTLFAHRLSLLKHTCTRKHQKATHKVFLKNAEKGGSLNDTENVGDNSVEDVESSIINPKVDNQPASVENESTELERLGPNASTQVQLRLKQKPSPPSGMTVTIIREDGSSNPFQFAVAELQNINEDPCRRIPATLVAPSQPEAIEESSNLATEESTMAQSRPSPLTSHVLDTSKGKPVEGIKVSLYRLIEGRWTFVNESITSPDGRCNDLIEKSNFVAGRYKLHFDVDRYFELQRQESMYPFVEIVFDVHTPQIHHHIPLLISPYGYTTYRGS